MMFWLSILMLFGWSATILLWDRTARRLHQIINIMTDAIETLQEENDELRRSRHPSSRDAKFDTDHWRSP